MAKNCTGNAYYSTNSGKCIECEDGQTVNADKSGCESVNVVKTKDQNDEITEECEYPRTLLNGECKCGYNTIEVNGVCKSIKEDFKTVISGFSTDNAFEFGEDELTETAKAAIQNNKDTIEQALKSYEDKTYCLYITGHTDRTGWKICKGKNNDCNENENKEFSKKRANKVLDELELNSDNKVRARGVGSEECDRDNHPQDNDSSCRKITFEIKEEECAD